MNVQPNHGQPNPPTPRRPSDPAEAPYEKNGELYRDFPGRDGYDPDFLGVHLDMPKLDDSIKGQAAPLLQDPSQTELKYTHFSVVMNKERRSPMVTAVNIDGSQYAEFERDGKWALDGRMDRKYQMGNEAYANNPIDKGHQVRRRDPMWGPDAEKGQDDTFVYTNSGLQHADLNQRNWLDLENKVLDSAVTSHTKRTVFTGPVLRDDDPTFDNKGKMSLPTKIPRQFWKVEVWNEPGVGLKSQAYVMDQPEQLGKSPDTSQHVKLTNFSRFCVPITQLEEMTHLKFDGLHGDNPKG